MSTLRFQALKETFSRKPVAVNEPERRSDIFGSNVFNEIAMRQYLTKALLPPPSSLLVEPM